MSSASSTITPEAAARDALSTRRRPKAPTRRKGTLAWLLVTPLLLFLLATFVWPITTVLWRSIANPELGRGIPATLESLKNWDGHDVPGDATFKALAQDLRSARDRGTGLVPAVGKRLGYEDSRLANLPSSTLAWLRSAPPTEQSEREAFIAAQPLWGQVATWKAVVQAGQALTPYYLLAALDRKLDPVTGDVVVRNADEALYVQVLARTLWIAFVVAVGCVVLGYPLAYWLSRQATRRANLLIIMVLLPFWTSLLVRTAGWIVLLQSGGIVNSGLLRLGLIAQPLELVFNRTGVYISMIHILLPFVILPLYAVMKGISGHYVRAAISLGAHPIVAFWRVYVPLTYAGVTAGALLVFIMAIGYYVTPALLGGPNEQMLSYFVAFYTNSTINWGMAAALGSQLLIIVLVMYAVYSRLTRPNQPVGN